ncbi:MAG: coenzyme F420-0:L-glutamate ligase [Anaerorhabdus sp.]
MGKNVAGTEKFKNGIQYYERGLITVKENEYERLAIHTHFVQRGESYIENIEKYVLPLFVDGDILSLSEKVISMCQDNCVEKKDVKLGFWAKFLSRFAYRTSAGIGMDEPYKLQLTIDLVGLPKVLFASFCSAVGKLFGKRGIFYKIVGHGVAGIDGFYPNSSFDIYKDMAVLNPKNADAVCDEIYEKLGIISVIVDANDIAQEILGKPKNLPIEESVFLEMIKDNPAGQGAELTPFILIREGGKNE